MHIDLVIMGGGIVGLSLGYELIRQFPELEFALFEMNPFVGEGSSSRNSGVLHAGLYYPTNSLKHELCIKGNRLWRDWVRDLNIPLNECGKYVLATCEEEIPSLIELFELAQKQNKVPGLRWVDELEVEKLKPYVNIAKAFFSSSTAVIDLPIAIKNLEHYLSKCHVPVMCQNQVREIAWDGEKFRLKTDHEELTCSYLINAAGHRAVELRQKLGLNDLSDYWVKGNYLKLKKKFYHEALIYPIPPKDLKGLGVHTTFDGTGAVRFGPNTEETEDLDYKVSDQVLAEMYPAINKVFKQINPSDLAIDYCGIRSKIKYQGKLYIDFWVKDGTEYQLPGYLEFCGIESPGFTSAPAMAQWGAEQVKRFFQF